MGKGVKGRGETGLWIQEQQNRRERQRDTGQGETQPDREAGKQRQRQREAERKRETWEVGRDFSKGNIVNVQRRCFNVYS